MSKDVTEKDVIAEFLSRAGFKENGRDIYTKENVGTIFIRQWIVITVLNQIMELGAKHQANKMREVLYMKDAAELYIFNPQV